MAKQQPRVAILMGSQTDWKVMSAATTELEALGISYEVRVTSAHRTPRATAAYVSRAPGRGVRVFIAGAGAAAHLAGAVAANTTLPVIGVPLDATSLGGIDSLLSTVQMPKGLPVATVAVGGAANAALLAAQILAVSDRTVAQKLLEMRKQMETKVARANRDVQKEVGRSR